MPGPGMGYLGNMGLGIDKYENSAPFTSMDPSAMMDPRYLMFLGPEMQQEYLRRQFNMENPRAALPQNFGGMLGGLGSQLINKMRGLPAAQPNGVQPAQQGQDPVASMIMQGASKYRQAHPDSNMGEAIAMSAQDIATQYPDNPQVSQVAFRAMENAKKAGWDPNIAAQKGFEVGNYINANTQQKKTMTTAQWTHLPDKEDWQKLGDVPQEPLGKTQSYIDNRGTTTERFTPNGPQKIVSNAAQPPQYAVNVTGGPKDFPGGIPGIRQPQIFDNAQAAKTTEELTNRSIASKNAIDSIDLLDRTATGSSVGKPGEISEHVSNVRSTIGTLAGMLGLSSNPNDYKMSASTWKNMAPALDRWAKAGIDAEKVKSLFLESALRDEATNGDKNASDANRKFSVEQHMKILGEDSSNLQALHETLQQRRGQIISQLNNEYDGKPNVMDKPSWLQKENGKTQASDLIVEAKEAIARGAPRDKVIERLRAKGVKDTSGL